MKITYLGHSCFRLNSKQGTAIVTDPYTRVGYELLPNITANAVTVSHGHFDHNYVESVQAKQIISTLGMHTVNEIDIVGVPAWHDPKQGALRGSNIVYLMQIDGMTVCHLGDLGEPCSAEILERIRRVDVLLIPVGGTYTVDAAQAKEYVDKIAPKVIIPMHYRPSDGALDITDCTPFLKLFNEGNVQMVKNGEVELLIDDLTENMRIIYMERKKK